ncbi:Asp23/Gls24 family envelope stress response protein [Marinococcus halotolerans]|uniref:Asp23/Gls24 family envelope stress response protein n=1 Tax=Marinococcus halotolerans TaxID=301092 RepID=UPI0003B70A25|nr:Asp23/Gls24 family envelope stress response protein [Marinococcus halotolerans]
MENQPQANTPNERNQESKLTFEDHVIKKIAAISAKDVDGILEMSGGFFEEVSDRIGSSDNITKGVNADVGERQAAIDVSCVVEYGKSIPNVYQQLKQSVKRAVSEMTGLEVTEVNMHVEDVLTKEEYKEKKTSRRDQQSDRVE